MQTPLLKSLDFASIYLAWLFSSFVVLGFASAIYVRQSIQSEHRQRVALVRDVSAGYQDYYQLLSAITTSASKGSSLINVSDVKESQVLAITYDSLISELKVSGDLITQRIRGADYLNADTTVSAFIERVQSLERILDVHIGYQIRKMAEPQPIFESKSSYFNTRVRLAKAINNYNILFSNTLLECNQFYEAMKENIRRDLDIEEREWRDILENPL